MNGERPTDNAQNYNDDDEIPDVNPQDNNNNGRFNNEEEDEDIGDFMNDLFSGNVNHDAFEMERNPRPVAPIPDPQPSPRSGTITSFFSRQSSVLPDNVTSTANRRARSASTAMESVSMGTAATPRSEGSCTPMAEEIISLPDDSRSSNVEIETSNRYSTRIANENEEMDLSSEPIFTGREEISIQETEVAHLLPALLSNRQTQQNPSESSNAGPSSISLPTSTVTYEQSPLKRKISFMDVDEDETEPSNEDLNSVVHNNYTI